MTFAVVVTKRAKQELREATNWIAKDAPTTAERWHDGFIDSLQTLSEDPKRCGHARENKRFPYELFQLLYGRRRSYRAVFMLREETVIILTIRHTARRDLKPEDLEGR